MPAPRPAPDPVGGVLLAAGASRRVGHLKQLLDWGGQSILRHVAQTLLDAGLDPVGVVLGHERDRLAKELAGLAVRIVENPDYEAGMVSSVRCGLGSLPPETAACVIALVDQPRVTAEVIRRLVERHRRSGAAVTLPRCGGQTGHPVVVGRDVITAVLSATSDSTLREVLSGFAARTSYLDVEDDSVLRDIDTQAAYEQELRK